VRDWLQFAVNSILAVVGIIAICIYYGQLKVMRGQLGEIVKQYPEIQKQAVASQTQAGAAQDSVKAIQEQMQIDERAWVQIRQNDSTISIAGNLTDGSPILVPMQFMNIGKTPAKDVNGMIAVSVYKKTDVPKFKYGNGYPAYQVNIPIMFAGYAPPPFSYAAQPITGPKGGKYSPVILTPALHQAINNREMIVLIHGTITYRDIFGIKRGTTFCLTDFPAGDLSAPHMRACADYNDAY
jgi:hypothetical protein